MLANQVAVGDKVAARRERQKRVAAMPFCVTCQRHIGTGLLQGAKCGACADPAPLRHAELLRFARLARKHWAGTGRELLSAAAHGYRPTLGVRLPHFSILHDMDPVDSRGERTACAERAELANLYDRIQAARSIPLRACRS